MPVFILLFLTHSYPVHLAVAHPFCPLSLSALSLFESSLTQVFINQPFGFLFKYYPGSPTDFAIASKNVKQLTTLLKSGKVRAVRHRLVEGGLEKGLLKGFEEMKAGSVRGEKLVIRVGGER